MNLTHLSSNYLEIKICDLKMEISKTFCGGVRMDRNVELVSPESIERSILLIRHQKVMLDSDLAELYEVTTKRLNEQVKRNRARFPEDFMFQLTVSETEILRSQIATSKKGGGGRRYRPYAFTEQGVAMLSSVLNSEEQFRLTSRSCVLLSDCGG